MSQELYIILNWLTFPNDQTSHIFISAWQDIYIKNQREWAKINISGLLMNKNFRILFESRLTITYMEINKNQGKVNFRIVESNFWKNLHLDVS